MSALNKPCMTAKCVRLSMSSSGWLWKRAMVLLCPVLLCGCSSILAGTAEPKRVVVTVKPVRTALRDVCISRAEADRLTEETAQAIEANNLALRKLAGRSSQCPPSVKRAPRANPPTS